MHDIMQGVITLGQLGIVALVIFFWIKYVLARIEDWVDFFTFDILIPTILLGLVAFYFAPPAEALNGVLS